MNDIRRPDREAEEIARIRAIVGRHAFPAFVTGFDVRLGEFHEEPSIWITFHTNDERTANVVQRRARHMELKTLTDAIDRDLIIDAESRFPYYLYQPLNDGQSSPA